MHSAVALTASILLSATQVVYADTASDAPPPRETQVVDRAPLREIGRVRATTPFCKDVVSRAVLAVNQAFDGDTRIAFLVADLSSIDLDSGLLSKNRAMRELDKRYMELRRGVLEGEHAISLLRDRTNTSTDSTERAELLRFTNALGGALDRQHKMLRDFNGFLAALDWIDPFDANGSWGANGRQMLQVGAAPAGGLSYAARQVARDFTIRSQDIYRDEIIAASHADVAFKRCSNALPDQSDDQDQSDVPAVKPADSAASKPAETPANAPAMAPAK